MVLNLLAQVEVGLVLDASLLSQVVQVLLHDVVVVFSLLDMVQEPDLLVLLVLVFLFGQVQLSDESVGLLSVFSDFLKVRLFHVLAFNLQLFVLIQKVSVLVLELADVS